MSYASTCGRRDRRFGEMANRLADDALGELDRVCSADETRLRAADSWSWHRPEATDDTASALEKSGRCRPARCDRLALRSEPITRICVYCGSNAGASPSFGEAAQQLGSALAHRGHRSGLRRWARRADGARRRSAVAADGEVDRRHHRTARARRGRPRSVLTRSRESCRPCTSAKRG